MLLGLVLKKPLQLHADIRRFFGLSRNVLIEKLAQRPLVSMRQLTNRLKRHQAIRMIRQGTVQALHGMIVQLERLTVQRLALAPVVALNEIIRVSLEHALHALDGTHLAVLALERGNGIQRLDVRGAINTRALREFIRLNVPQNIQWGITVRNPSANVVPQRLLDIRTRLKRLGQRGGNTGLNVHRQVGPIGKPQWQPVLLIVLARHDVQIPLHLRQIIAAERLGQRI